MGGSMAERDEVEVLLEKIIEKFGASPRIDRFYSEAWRVWVHGWHIHLSSASYGSFAAEGKTLKEAAKRLLELAEKHPVIKSDDCTDSCPHYTYDGY